MRGVSRRQLSRGRRLSAAVVVGMALPLLLACWSAHAAAGITTPAALPSLVAGLPGGASLAPATPCPSVSPTGRPAPTPSPLGLPLACAPVPSPSVTAVPGLGSNPGIPGNTTGAGTPSTATGPAPGSAPITVPVAPTTRSAATTVGSAMFGNVLGLLVAPANVGVENPALRHFVLEAPAAAHSATVDSAAAPSVPSAMPLANIHLSGALLASIVIPCLVVTLGLLAARRVVATRFRRAVDYAAVPFGSAAALSLLLLVPSLAPSTTTTAAARPASLSEAAPAVVQAARTLPRGSAEWQRLIAIESTVAALQAQLQESSTDGGPPAQLDPTLHPTRYAASVQPNASPSMTVQLENAIQSEYSFYVSAVQHPDQQQALLADSQTVSTDVRGVVLYDLQAVATQLSQEAAIESAQQSALAGTGPAPTTLLAPELGSITQGFGPSSFAMEPPLTFDGVTYPHFHTGVDIAAPLDTPVGAAADGVVVIAGSTTDLEGNLVGYGNYVVIAHAGKLVTLYGHLDKLLVHAGQTVKAGQPIGLEGSTGNSSGPHLHFEVHLAGLLVDPMRYLGTQIQPQ